MEERKFKEGDEITYKSRQACGGNYNFGGDDQGGFVGTINRYYGYHEKYNCYSLSVTNKDGSYEMLESEFEEYDSADKEPTYEIF
jgi:hypothetical protein